MTSLLRTPRPRVEDQPLPRGLVEVIDLGLSLCGVKKGSFTSLVGDRPVYFNSILLPVHEVLGDRVTKGPPTLEGRVNVRREGASVVVVTRRASITMGVHGLHQNNQDKFKLIISPPGGSPVAEFYFNNGAQGIVVTHTMAKNADPLKEDIEEVKKWLKPVLELAKKAGKCPARLAG